MEKDQINRSWAKDSHFIVCKPHPYTRSKLLFAEEMGYFHTYAPYSTERYFKDAYLFVTTVKGKGNLLYENKRYILEEGDTFLIDCRKYHKYWSEYSEDWSFYWVHLNGLPMISFDSLFRKQGIVIKRNDAFFEEKMIELINSEEEKMSAFVKEIHHHVLLNSMLSEFLLAQIQFLSFQMEAPDFLIEVLMLYEENISQIITLEDIEQKLNISKYMINKCFKKYLNMTPHQYLTKLRLQEAQKLLIRTDLPINEVARKIGIPNVSHFINIFKRNFGGLTPVQFRFNHYMKI
ncbi:AraC family transcriptional regulator [Solibacillus silvestris]|uniref:AraC family transcriptional regulator n=1 Tax=Solibacillus silvestris TaxID=76853 RepID=UPI003F7EF37A